MFFIPAGFVCSMLCKGYKNLWLVCERGDDARDNGYWFYKHLKDEHPEVNSRFVISKSSADFDKIKSLGGEVEYRSFKHYLAYFSAKFLIGTHVQPCAPDKIMYYHLAKKGVRPKAKQVFLQHGITMNDMSWLNADNLYIDLFVCGGLPEYNHINETYGHIQGIVKYLGLARFDNLIKSDKCEKIILVMPTWRGSNYPSGKDFLKTEYYRAFNDMLSDERLIALLNEKDYKLIFYPHIEMQKYMKDFKSDSDRIIKADKESHDVQRLLMECSMLITDYSSVFFDVAYLKKPIIYYQFDQEEFRKYHYKESYFDFNRDGFGPVCTNKNELFEAIELCFENNMKMANEYEKRCDGFFKIRDDKNCERIFDEILKLDTAKS